jgi:peroxiredoxin
MQNLLKSIFIALFPMFAIYALVDSILHLVQHEFSYHYIGQLISALTIVVFFAGLFITSQARTKRHLDVYTIFIGVGLVISFVDTIFSLNYNSNLIILCLVLGWLAYITWYSVFKNRNTTILKVGKQLPNFELEDSNKNKISSSSFLGHPSIFLFYRGNWCPLCMAQIKEIVAQYKAIEERGVNTVLISPQPHKFSKSLAEKYNVNFKFLTDSNNVVAKQLGIFAKNGIPTGFQIMGYDNDTVLPTVIITDAKGNIVFADLTDNYRVRPEPETFLKVIDSIT